MSEGRYLHYRGNTLDMKLSLACDALETIDLDGDILNWLKTARRTRQGVKDIVTGGDTIVLNFATRKDANSLLPLVKKEAQKNNVIDFSYAWLEVDGIWWLMLTWDYREIRQENPFKKERSNHGSQKKLSSPN